MRNQSKPAETPTASSLHTYLLGDLAGSGLFGTLLGIGRQLVRVLDLDQCSGLDAFLERGFHDVLLDRRLQKDRRGEG